MGDFFHGWRRKAGCITLVLALILMGGWVRSLKNEDIVDLHVKVYGLESQHFGSRRASLYWSIDNWVAPTFLRFKSEELADPDQSVVKDFDDLIDDVGTTFFSKWLGFGISYSFRMFTLIIPYWSITIPLTLISIWLLLSKPHKSIQKKINEPNANEGATT